MFAERPYELQTVQTGFMKQFAPYAFRRVHDVSRVPVVDARRQAKPPQRAWATDGQASKVNTMAFDIARRYRAVPNL